MKSENKYGDLLDEIADKLEHEYYVGYLDGWKRSGGTPEVRTFDARNLFDAGIIFVAGCVCGLLIQLA